MGVKKEVNSLCSWKLKRTIHNTIVHFNSLFNSPFNFPFNSLLVFSFYLLVSPAPPAQGQGQPNVLFIGNSYTEVNNLPQMTAAVARSMGYEMTYCSNTPGGCTFSQHCTNQSMNLIRQGGWDFVVLQEQSQYPSFPQEQVEAEVFPYAAQLVGAVYNYNPCAEPMFYMTWGRRDGDQYNAPYFPILGTYEGMDSMLCLRYLYMAEANDASVCPVGRVWRSLRENHPEIELYQSDGSHPSTAGTYAAACAFSVMFFHTDPLLATYIPSGLTESDARVIRQTVHEVVYSRMAEWTRPEPQADFSSVENDGSVATFVLRCSHADSATLAFGDGSDTLTVADDSLLTLQHTYTDSGHYEVTLIATRHCMADTATVTIYIPADTDTVSIPQFSILNWFDKLTINQLSIIPNPSHTVPTVTLFGQVVPTDARWVTVIDVLGNRIPYAYFHSHFTEIPSGVYLIQAHHDGKTYQARFIKV